jgi:hypothetical protein
MHSLILRQARLDGNDPDPAPATNDATSTPLEMSLTIPGQTDAPMTGQKQKKRQRLSVVLAGLI